MNSGPALSARGLEFGFGSADSFLLGVDLEVAPGEMVALIGPNGSGKTTLLKLLSWSLKPRAGEVRIMGDPAGSLSARERARRLALVPQQPSLAFPFTALEVILMGRAPYLGRFELEGGRDLELAAEILRATRLAGFERRRFHELSGGEKQRVMIAKALAQEPKVLLLDEPTAFLDLRHQVEVYELARKLSRERGLATLAASHDINLAAMFCDRIAALGEGRILAAGKPAEILDPEFLSRVYGVKVERIERPERPHKPLVFPVGSEERP